MNSFSLKLLFLVMFASYCSLNWSQTDINYDSVINLINKTATIEKKIDIYTESTRPFLVSLKETEIKAFNLQLLSQIKPKDKELFKLESKLLEAKLLAFSNKNDSAELSLKKLLISKNKKHNLTYCNTIEMLGLVYLNSGKHQKALQIIDDCLNSQGSTLSNKQLAGLHYVKGITFSDMRFLNLSTKELLIADSLTEGANRKRIFYYQGLAANFGELKDLASAEKYLIKAYHLSKKLNDEFATNLTNIELGALYQEQSLYEKCDSILRETKNFFEKNYNPMFLGNMLDLRAKNSFLKGDYLVSIASYQDKLKLPIIQGDSIRLSNTYVSIAKNYVKLGNIQKSKTYLDSSYSFFIVSKNSIDYLHYLQTKGELKKLEGDFEHALNIYEEHDSIEKERLKISDLNKANELKYYYETDKKEKENLLLKTEKTEIEKEKQSQFYQLLIGIILLSLGMVFIFLLYRNRQRRNIELEQLDTLKSKFFESISHELRTPLTLIQLPVQKAIEDNNPIPKQDLKTIKYNTKRLQNLMDDLLSITRIEANKYPISITENNITQQTNILSAQFDSLAESNNIEYIKNIQEESAVAHYDKEVYNKVLINLISNAIKYSDKGGKVEVNFKLGKEQAILKIADEGKGIRKEYHQYIFDKFYRVNQNNENVPGSGIGLSIVKELLEVIGGSISFESKEGEGTQFLVHFPLKEVVIVSENSSLESSKNTLKPNTKNASTEKGIEYEIDNAEKPIVLVVEDNEELLSYIQKELSEKYKVLTANNGEKGIEKGVEIVPDLIISDWLMPEKNGIELCEAIKQNEITSHVPIVMLTAKTEIEDKIKGFETGADAYVAKPFEMSLLKAQVHNIIKQRKKILEKLASNEILISTKEFSDRDLEFWNKLKEMVVKNISNPDFSIQALADGLFVSRMQLNRKVKALINITGSDYIIKEKMILAKKLLKNNDLQISEIAYRVGYENAKSFARAFKKETKKTPTDYRKEL